MKRWLLLLGRMNWWMTLSIAALAALGVAFIYSACYVSDDLPVSRLYRRQLFWLGVGAPTYAAFALVDYHRLGRRAWWLYGGCLGLLVLVLLVGRRVYGARRWLMLFGVAVQPAELAKLAMVVLLARLLSRPDAALRSFRYVGGLLALVLVPVLLIMKQPDLGTSLVFMATLFLMMMAAGVRARILAGLVGTCMCVAALILGAVFLPERMGASPETCERMARMTGLSAYQRNRIAVFVQPRKDPLGAGWNKMQSEIAVGSGGMTGKGYLRGTQNVLGFLPRTVAPTDFIFSVIAEEMGFRGSVAILGLYGILLLCGLWGALAARDKLGRLLVVGVMGTVFCHVLINVGMTVGVMPITGLPLPFVSYGGSFTVCGMMGMGIVQSVFVRRRSV